MTARDVQEAKSRLREVEQTERVSKVDRNGSTGGWVLSLVQFAAVIYGAILFGQEHAKTGSYFGLIPVSLVFGMSCYNLGRMWWERGVKAGLDYARRNG